MANRLCARGSAWLARNENIMAGPAQSIRKTANLGGFACPLAPFECHKQSGMFCHAYFRTSCFIGL